jgi:hypothetical protein
LTGYARCRVRTGAATITTRDIEHGRRWAGLALVDHHRRNALGDFGSETGDGANIERFLRYSLTSDQDFLDGLSKVTFA